MADSSPFPYFEGGIEEDIDLTMRPLQFGTDPDYFIEELGRDTTLPDLDFVPSHITLSNVESHPTTHASNSSSSHRGSTSSGSSRSIDGTSPNTTRTSMDAVTADLPLDLFKFGNGLQHDDVMIEDGSDYAEFVNFEGSPMNPDFSMKSELSPGAPFQNGVPQKIEPSQGPAAKRRKAPAAKTAKKPRERKKARAKSPKDIVSPVFKPVASTESSPTPHPSTNIPSPAGDIHDATSAFGNGMQTAWQPSPQSLVNTAFWQQPVTNPPAHGLPVYSSQSPAVPRLVIHPMPAKSRVETQIQLKITLHNLPKGIKRVHLPTHAIAKTKLLHKPPPQPHPDMVHLSTMLVCTTAMYDEQNKERALARAAKRPLVPDVKPADDEDPKNGGEVRICENCINRERKRAGRKKHKKVEEEELWNKFQNERAIVINTQEVKEWQIVTPSMADPTGAGLHSSVPEGTVQVETPMRIACYCRHHSEKNGFRVIITLRDYQGSLIAQEISGSIMITDDHKTGVPSQSQADQLPENSSQSSLSNPHQIAIPPQPNASQGLTANTIPSPPQQVGASVPIPFQQDPRQSASLPIRATQSTSDLQSMNETAPFQPVGHHMTPAPPRNIPMQASPTSPLGGNRKRKASMSAKVPAGLAMTKIETNQPSTIMPPKFQNEPAPMVSAGNSPYAQSPPQYPMNGEIMSPQAQQPMFNNLRQSFGPGRITPNGGEPPFAFGPTNGTMGLDMSMNQLFSAPASAHHSRAPSPSHLPQHALNAQRTQDIMAAFAAPKPAILRIIPPEGPKSGGVEITILGRNFTNDGLEVYFGPQKATTTTWWGETSLVCMLPPSPTAGRVPVTIQQPGKRPAVVSPSASFTYVDDDEQQLLRTAVTILGHKFTGCMTDALEIAKTIVLGEGGASGSNPNFGSSFDMNGHGNNHAALEADLLRILELIDMDDSSNRARLNLRRSSGQTMLHLACSLGLHRFVAGLLSRGANVNIKDKGGFTPLHMAAMNDHPDIVRRLIAKGAERYSKSKVGLTPAAVARSQAVLSNLQSSRIPSRSRSVGSLHSRASSTSSLVSLWGHTQMMPTVSQEFMSDSSDSSREPNTDESTEDVSEEENGLTFGSRRASLADPLRRTSIVAPHVVDATDTILATPNATMTNLREQLNIQLQQIQHALATLQNNIPQFQFHQFHQLQNSVTTQIQNFGGQMMPDYTAPVMQRISSLVPNIRGPRPQSPGNDTTAPPTDDHSSNKKWGVLPFFGVKDVPPAYEDIFPQKDMDAKQASAAQAAVEGAADAKCEVLYDQNSSETMHGAIQTEEIPTTLEIGRKHRITKQQQETLQRAHAQSLKTGSRDKMLWFVWIPILVFVLCAMLYSGAPSLVSGTAGVAKTFATIVVNPREIGDRVNRYLQELA
ncbi:hypothetical protein F5Y16DRAFT_377313 [Xylariaceae sp. FL0255]|nr:hypothetical protein F5Y16DRAFT_377313 [Xylariaceae sp. FL0255]